jgi:hypothetical protein
VSGLLILPVRSQQSERSCICVLGLLGKINNPNTQIHDRSLSWLGTGKINNPNTQIHDRSHSWLGTGKESERSCSCVLG